MSDAAFRASDNFLRGRSGERVVATMVQERGCFVVPSYDYAGEDGNKAPKMEGARVSYVLPDLDVSKNGSRYWVEVKTKGAATLHRKTGRLEHGISKRHYEHYQQVQAISGCPVWLFVVEEDDGLVLCERLDVLSKGARFYEGPKMGWAGMVFFPRSAFRVYGRCEEAA